MIKEKSFLGELCLLNIRYFELFMPLQSLKTFTLKNVLKYIFKKCIAILVLNCSLTIARPLFKHNIIDCNVTPY